MIMTYTAKYTKTESGYMGQLIEWPEIVTEGENLEECRAMLRDALHEMMLAYSEQQKEIPFDHFAHHELQGNVPLFIGNISKLNFLGGDSISPASQEKLHPVAEINVQQERCYIFLMLIDILMQ